MYLYIQGVRTAKPVEFLGTSRNDLRKFPSAVRVAIGQELREVQRGFMPADFKAMPAIGQGVHEIRIRLDGAWRVLYVAKYAKAIYVLHAFQKKTQKTAKEDIELAVQRYRMIGE